MRTLLSPLHQAVIANDLSSVEFYRQEEALSIRDPYGLTALELAQLLGHYECVRLLGGVLPDAISVHLKGETQKKIFSLADFEKEFNLIYRAFLTFPSYDVLVDVIKNCPYILKSRYLAEENYAWGHVYHEAIQNAQVADVYIRWIDDVFGYGLFAGKDLSVGTFVGEYAGSVRRLFRHHPDPNGYCLHYPTRFWSWKYYVIDALREGNVTRFINHSDEPNLRPLCTIDRGLLRQIFVVERLVKKDSQLTFDYGMDYWQRRQKL